METSDHIRLCTQKGASTAAMGVDTPGPVKHTRGLLLVGAYKVLESLVSIALGAGALHLVHKDVGDLLMQVVDVLRISPENHAVMWLMDRADLIGGHQLREFSMLTFGYAGLHLIEGTGLMFEKTWAEYFTVVLTALGLPWETYELIEHFTLLKVALLVANLTVLLYLLWELKRKRRRRGTSAM